MPISVRLELFNQTEWHINRKHENWREHTKFEARQVGGYLPSLANSTSDVICIFFLIECIFSVWNSRQNGNVDSRKKKKFNLSKD